MTNANGNSAHRQSILIVSDQAGFARDVIARWQMEHHVPEFTALGSELWQRGVQTSSDVAIAGDISAVRSAQILNLLNRGAASTLYVASAHESVHALRREYSRLIVIPRHDAWLDTIVLLAQEVLRRTELTAHMERLERSAKLNEKYAVLGRYMVEMRHNFNNALTSVLGNAELLLLESSEFTPTMSEQLQILHAMSLRMHEMMQRFTSLELEWQCAERSSHSESNVSPLSYAARI